VTDKHAPREACLPGLRDICDGVRQESRAGTPVDTGTLRAGWRTSRTAGGDPTVVNDVPYARFVEYGTAHRPPVAMLGRALARYRAMS
jgi:Bacteriophage HK97-gp10, putative tail-component